MLLLRWLLALCLLSSAQLPGQCDDLCPVDPAAGLMRDLMIVEQVNCKLCDRMPVTYNYTLQGGYFVMPSARVAGVGSIRVGFASVPPYSNINIVGQPFSNLEASFNYRIFNDVPDPRLSPLGFGDLSDRGVNVKFALLLPEDTGYVLPGIAIGFDDFLGTKNFYSSYIVATQVWPSFNLEATLGYGGNRINGFFGGALWLPFRQCGNPWFKDLGLAVEYDATDYQNPIHEKHPRGRDVAHRFNYGMKYRLCDYLDFNVSSVRGNHVAWSLSACWDLGAPLRLIPPLDDPMPYTAPVNLEPMGDLRTPTGVAEDLLYAFRQQGIDVWEIGLSNTCCGQELHLWVSTCQWMYEGEVYLRIRELLLALTPHDVDVVVVTLESKGLPVQEYVFKQPFMMMVRNKEICRTELGIISPEREASYPDCAGYTVLYKRAHPWWNFWAAPKLNYLFGSSQGKFKYALGVTVGTDGFLFDQLFYRFRLGYIAKSSIPNTAVQDTLNPSQLPNVHTDILTYYAVRQVTVDEALLQKNLNLGCGWYTRFSTGLFSQFYGGFAGEVLYYPVCANWAIGFEYDKLYKRTTEGIGFTKTIRKLDGMVPTYIPFHGQQYFLDLYYQWAEADLDMQLSLGRFLAGDHGGRIEVSRTYASGLRLSAWFTYTDGHDHINGHLYFDKGIGIEMPLDVFLTYSSCETWCNYLSAWLRDVGYRTDTGDTLYWLIRQKRL